MKFFVVLLIVFLAACGDDSNTNNATNNQNNQNNQNNAADSGGEDAGSDMAASDMSSSDMGILDMTTTDVSISDMTTADMTEADMSTSDSGMADMSTTDMSDEMDTGSTEDVGVDMAPTACDPYATNPCGTGEKCMPEERDTATGDITGFCIAAGQGEEGDSCDPGAPQPECGAGLFCGTDTCVPHCDPQAANGDPGACTSPAQCADILGSGGATLDWGYCLSPCDPFGTNTCPSGEKCVPEARDPATGEIYGSCETSAAGQLGDTCDGSLTQVQCGHGLICAGGQCTSICDSQATAGAGTCGTNQACSALFDNMGNELIFGSCIGTCDYNHGDPGNPTRACTDSSKACAPGELIGVSYDYCGEPPAQNLAEGANCTTNGLSEFDSCGLNSLCLDLTGSVLCYDLCMTSEGAFFSSPHVDCRDTSDVCNQQFAVSTFGVCR